MSKTKKITTKQLRQKEIKELHKMLSEARFVKDYGRKERLLVARIKTVLAEKRQLAKLEVTAKKKQSLKK